MRIIWPALGALLIVLVAAADRPQQGSDKWEYAVQLGAGSGIKPDRHKAQLDSLGREGWELVAVVGAEMGGNTGTVVMYLKRRLQ